jgi:hypothetical protein
LEKISGLPAAVGGAEFDFFRGTLLQDVSVQSSNGPHSAGKDDPPLLTINRLHVEHDPFSLLFGRFRVRGLTVDSPAVHLLASPDNPLLKMTLPRAGDADVRDLPPIEIANARINMSASNRPSPPPILLSIRGQQSGDGMYNVVWQREGDKAETGRMQVDIARGVLRSVDGGSPWLSTEMLAAAAEFAGPQVSEWLERLGARGEIRARDFTIPLTSDEAGAVVGSLELRNAVVSIPVAEEENAVAPSGRYLQFTGVSAQVDATREDIRAVASASLHGSPVELTLETSASLGRLKLASEAGFTAKLVARDVRFPRRGPGAPEEEDRFVRLAPRFTRFYDDYNPEGVVDVQLSITRPPGPDQRLRLDHATFHAKQGSVYTRFFPYPVSDVTGVVEMTPTGVYIRDMCGGRAGGSACLNGWLEALRRCSATTLEVQVQDVLVDEELFTGLGPRRAWIRERFNPLGRVDATVVSYRPACDPEAPAPWTTEVDVFPDRGSAWYTELPYTLSDLTGRIQVRRDNFSIELNGLAGAAPISIIGGGGLEDRKITDLDLRVAATGVSLDQEFTKALPPEAAGEVAKLHPMGTVNIESQITSGPAEGKVVHHTVVSLNNAAIEHQSIPLPITGLTGDVIVQPGQIRLRNVMGRYQEAWIAAAGEIPTRGSDETRKLLIGIEDLTLDKHVLAAAPPQLRQALETWRLTGPVDARVGVTASQSRPGELEFRGDVLLSGNTVQPTFVPDRLRDVRAVIHFEPGRISGQDVEANYGRAPVIANFKLESPPSGGSRGEIKLLATKVPVNNEFIGLLPPSARDAFRRMGAAGDLDIQVDRLAFFRRSPSHDPVWSVEAGIRLNDVALPAIGGMQRVLGVATVKGAPVDAQGGVSLSGDLRVQHASVFGRDLIELTAPWSFARTVQGDAYLTFDPIAANIYGGRLTGRTEVQFSGGPPEFSLTSVIQGMELSTFLNAGRRTPYEIEARGTVNANLYLTGEAGHLDTLRGGGQFEVVDGWLYKLPIIIAILNVLELSSQPGDAFDEAAAEFYIVGDRVTLRDIVVKGGVLALVGEGFLTIPDLAVSLRLVNVPGSWWARLPLIEDLMRGTVREFVELRVSGPLTQPSVKTQPIPRITDEIKRLFERRRSNRVVPPG